MALAGLELCRPCRRETGAGAWCLGAGVLPKFSPTKSTAAGSFHRCASSSLWCVGELFGAHWACVLGLYGWIMASRNRDFKFSPPYVSLIPHLLLRHLNIQHQGKKHSNVRHGSMCFTSSRAPKGMVSSCTASGQGRMNKLWTWNHAKITENTLNEVNHCNLRKLGSFPAIWLAVSPWGNTRFVSQTGAQPPRQRDFQRFTWGFPLPGELSWCCLETVLPSQPQGNLY